MAETPNQEVWQRKGNSSAPTDDIGGLGASGLRVETKSSKPSFAKQRQKKRNEKKKPMNADRRNMWLLIATTVLVIISVILFMPPAKTINQGLDIQGGLSVVLEAKNSDGSDISSEEMEKSRAIIETRVNLLGASEATVQLQGENQILVQIPGMSDTQEALATIGKTGKLEFARLDSFTDPDVVSKIQSGQYGSNIVITDEFGNQFPTEQTVKLEVMPGTYEPLITGENINTVNVGKASETGTDYSVNLKLDSAGTAAFAEATADLAPTHGLIVIILDGIVQSAPAVQGEIPSGDVSITGNYTLEEAKSLQTVLESGSLPVSFEYAQSQVVGPTLGQDALRAGLLVAIIGLIVVMLYLLFFYKGLGIITAAAMVVFAVLYLGILALLSRFGLFSLSLAGIAGIVLTIGMAADSSILTLERFREEIRMGRTVRAASISGVRHAIMTSIDADLVTLVSALCLFFLASASVKGFGLTLALGIFCDIAMMLLFKAPIIRLLAPRAIEKNPGFWDIKDCQDAVEIYNGSYTAALEDGTLDDYPEIDSDATEAPRTSTLYDAATLAAGKIKGRFIKRDINFMGYRKILLIIAAVCVVLSFAVFAIRGLNLGIEFVGGTSITFFDTGDVTTEQLRDAFAEAGEDNAVIQTTQTSGEEGFLVRTTTTSAEDAAATANKVASTFGWSTDSFEVTTIGPDWGSSVVRSSLIAFLVSLVLIIIYIGIRFEFKMGVMAIVALLHDLIIVLGIYALVGREVNPNTIAALLTILGYSLYDTVVVFHRINDNMQGDSPKVTFISMANHSINQVFLRTINTTLTSLIPVVFMLIFGGETLKDFAFAMAIGLICGSYSSIAIATPLFSWWKEREQKFKRLRRKYGDDITIFQYDRPLCGAMELKAQQALPAASSAAGVDASSSVDDALSATVAVVSEQPDAPRGATANQPRKTKNKSTHGQKKVKRPVKPK